MGPRAGLDSFGEKEIFCLSWNSIPQMPKDGSLSLYSVDYLASKNYQESYSNKKKNK
jgi:hypothetical protein